MKKWVERLNYLNLLGILPGVQKPELRLPFREKLKWTGIMLLLFYVMSQIFVWGTSPEQISQFLLLEQLLGASIGTLMTLGIGPIVTASIILQLLVGSKILNWDLHTSEGKNTFMGTQKILAVAFCFFEAFAFVTFGAIPANPTSPLGPALTTLILILQIAMGGIIVILMDEVISKWGIGSGVSLFIAAGVSREILIRAINFVGDGGALGLIPSAVTSFAAGQPLGGIAALIPIAFTLIVFFVAVYAQAIKVEIPLAHGQISGFGPRWPLKFIYTSNIPVILVAALLANLQLWARLMQSQGLALLGTLDANGVPTSGLIALISPPRGQDLSSIVVAAVSGAPIPSITFSWVTYAIFMVIGSVVFASFWVRTSGMDAQSVAAQVNRMGLTVPGFRRDPRIVEGILEKYISALTILGAIFVGLLAAFADFTGALGTGTGILLTVMIIYQLYEQIAQQNLEDMHPALRKFMGSS